MKRGKYFNEETALEFIWRNADGDGIWRGDAVSLAAEFEVTEDDAYSVLTDLCDSRIIERVYKQTYVIVNWRENEGSADIAIC